MIKRVFFGIIFLVLSVPYSLVYGLLMIVLFFTGKRILNRFEEIFVFPILEVVIYGRKRNDDCCGNCVSFLYESANGTGWCEKKKKLQFCDGFCKEHKIKCNNKKRMRIGLIDVDGRIHGIDYNQMLEDNMDVRKSKSEIQKLFDKAWDEAAEKNTEAAKATVAELEAKTPADQIELIQLRAIINRIELIGK